MKWNYRLILLAFCSTIKAQNNVDLIIAERDINNLLTVVKDARAFNIGDYKNHYGLNYWYLNLEAATLNLKPNNQVEIYNVRLEGGVEMDLWLFSLTPTGAITATIYGEVQIGKNDDGGYSCYIIPNDVPVLFYRGSLQAIIDPIVRVIQQNYRNILPTIEINLGTSFFPDIISQYFVSGIPDFRTTDDELILSLEVLSNHVSLNNMHVKSGDNLEYKAASSIKLKDGFTVKNGAYFKASIAPKPLASSSVPQINSMPEGDIEILEPGTTVHSYVEPAKVEFISPLHIGLNNIDETTSIIEAAYPVLNNFSLNVFEYMAEWYILKII